MDRKEDTVRRKCQGLRIGHPSPPLAPRMGSLPPSFPPDPAQHPCQWLLTHLETLRAWKLSPRNCLPGKLAVPHEHKASPQQDTQGASNPQQPSALVSSRSPPSSWAGSGNPKLFAASQQAPLLRPPHLCPGCLLHPKILPSFPAKVFNLS